MQIYTSEYIADLERRCEEANFAPFDITFPDGKDFEWNPGTVQTAEDWLAGKKPSACGPSYTQDYSEIISQLTTTKGKLQTQIDAGIIDPYIKGMKEGRVIAYRHAIRKIRQIDNAKGREKIEALIEELEAEWEQLTKEYMSAHNGTDKQTSDYFLTLGKASQLGETIDKIKESLLK